MQVEKEKPQKILDPSEFLPYLDHFAYDDNDSSDSSELRAFFYADVVEKERNSKNQKDDELLCIQDKVNKLRTNILDKYDKPYIRTEQEQIEEHIKKENGEEFQKNKTKTSNKEIIKREWQFYQSEEPPMNKKKHDFYCGECRKTYKSYCTMMTHIRLSHDNVVPDNSILEGKAWTLQNLNIKRLNMSRSGSFQRRSYRFKNQVAEKSSKFLY